MRKQDKNIEQNRLSVMFCCAFKQKIDHTASLLSLCCQGSTFFV